MTENIKIPAPPEWVPKWYTKWLIEESAKDGLIVEVDNGKSN